MKTRAIIAVLVLSVAGASYAQVRKVVRTDQKFTVNRDGTFALDNPVGNVEVVGSDVTQIEASIATIFVAEDQSALDDARRHADIAIGGDERTRVVRTVISNPQKRKWTVTAHWNVKVPRSINVRVVSEWSDRIRITNVHGNVYVKNFNGNVALDNVTASTFAESVNGSIVYTTPKPRGNVMLSTVNGHVTASVAADADFRWVAETAMGDIRTNLPARGAFLGATFRGSVNAPGGPTITTNTLMGNIHLLASGSSATTSESLRKMPPSIVRPSPQSPMTSNASSTGPRVLRRGTVNGVFSYSTNIGDVRVQEVKGSAEVFTGAGAVQIGLVNGTANVKSHGGPLELGEILGPLTASTRAGDILVDSTRRGGTIETQGGTIRLLYTSGPTRLVTGGGDITVRQAAAPVAAETASGDIAITVDPLSKTEKIDAKTGKGNI
ncbi:MAG TPA: hypothetical protein VHK90_04930, partial [Thermoanaerobaculia bacterium]|nr:hypothetical protein [Thermoanaerobaculia bacterium]